MQGWHGPARPTGGKPRCYTPGGGATLRDDHAVLDGLFPPEQSDVSFRVFSDIARLLVSESDLSRLLESIADSVRDLLPADHLIIYQADTALRQLRPVLVRSSHAEEIYSHTCSFGEGITGSAAERREAVLANDAHLDPRAQQIPGTPREEESLMSVPLLARGDLKGMLNLYRQGEGNWFEPAELDLAKRFGEMAALALDNAQIRERLETEVVTDHLTGLYNHRYYRERLSEEMGRSVRSHRPVSLVVVDIDDFKTINEMESPLTGDHVLVGVGTLLRAQARPEDVICRTGGEEFALIMPGLACNEALAAAEVLRRRIAEVNLNGQRSHVTVSVGVAEGPAHASSPSELMASANYALLQAKSAGKNRVAAYQEGEWSGVRAVPQDQSRMAGQLKVLQGLASKLNRLLDVRQIGDVLLEELRTLIDYDACRVHLLETDGITLRPIAFRGKRAEYENETEEALTLEVGKGITGRVATTGESIYAPDARLCEFSVLIPGTPDLDESILTVPLKFGERVVGTIGVSKLGLGQFDSDDLRLLESLASHVAVALENARLFEEERQTAETSNALLRVSQALTRRNDTQGVLEELVGSCSDLWGGVKVSAWVRDGEGSFRCVSHVGFSPEEEERVRGHEVGEERAARYLLSEEEPFFIPEEGMRQLPEDMQVVTDPGSALVAPVKFGRDGLAVIVAVGQPGWRISSRHFRLARGIADMASLALGNADRFADMEKAFMETVEVLANALEAKDSYTGGHARQVAEMAVTVAKEVGITGPELRDIELAGIFHDIGKIGVRTEVIRKPGPLTEEEWEDIRRHPEIGDQILEPVEFLQPVRPIIRACHERWDGDGYPDGIAKEAIPLGARIIFVCDAWHAMTSDRAYRKALPEAEAVRRLKDAAGTQFDPSVVEAFLRAHEAGRIPYDPHGH